MAGANPSYLHPNLLIINTNWFENVPVLGTKAERSEISPAFSCFKGSRSALNRVNRDQGSS